MSGQTEKEGLADLSFEEALSQLEAIVRSLEAGRSTLAEAIGEYERGAALRRHCEQKLAEAEAKVQAVVEGRSGLSLRDVE
ncbi:exodeoxyribonuclease VII small subunit [Sabulicella glaciei]|uniref:Exodeoxyribonuclease 7 small subunit n=1 Tax=Sabulicella glaciei TaxID=2984948 RepID=A0ABT3NW77_9PROT|nr:exodeoxyribonuclease VII small subunit [Roseococcus sp. MDT2-1-1]MCW8086418.1 exodeoxyribonuclease VII small subunit [Roseococcus sp. MDT2-1-1]